MEQWSLELFSSTSFLFAFSELSTFLLALSGFPGSLPGLFVSRVLKVPALAVFTKSPWVLTLAVFLFSSF